MNKLQILQESLEPRAGFPHTVTWPIKPT